MEETALQYDVDQELLANFLDESEESLESLDKLFVELEQQPNNKEIIDSIFRVAHSIKGLAAFLSLRSIKNLTHEIETFLHGVREDRLYVDSSAIDCLLSGFDELSRMLARVRSGKSEVQNENHLKDLITRIKQLSGSIASDVDREVSNIVDDPANKVGLNSRKSTGPNNTDSSIVERVMKGEIDKTKEPETATKRRSMRVSEEKIDVFMQYVGDLIGTSESFNLLQKRIESTADNRLAREFRNINLAFGQLSDKLQRSLLEIRKVPAGNLFQKIPRMVRDLANALEKKVCVEITGQNVQIDKSTIEALESPVNHLVRNCVDHGIEMPDERRRAGKNETGTVEIEISEQGDNVVMAIHDDGLGINPQEIREKAVQMRLTTAEQAEALSESEILQFIFHPGFSTAKRVSDVSGRGVGMDVVRANVESLQGTIELESDYGHGSTITLRLPSGLTVLVVNGVLAGVGDQQYIVKLEDIHEVIRPKPEDILTVGGVAECLYVRGEIYPLISLKKLFGVKTEFTSPTNSIVILSHTKNRRAGILVDRILGQQKAVVKDLRPQFSHLKMIAGTAILANTKVGLVLDIPAIVDEFMKC